MSKEARMTNDESQADTGRIWHNESFVLRHSFDIRHFFALAALRRAEIRDFKRLARFGWMIRAAAA